MSEDVTRAFRGHMGTSPPPCPALSRGGCGQVRVELPLKGPRPPWGWRLLPGDVGSQPCHSPALVSRGPVLWSS